MRRALIILLLALLLCGCGEGEPTSELEILFFDVGSADAALLRTAESAVPNMRSAMRSPSGTNLSRSRTPRLNSSAASSTGRLLFLAASSFSNARPAKYRLAALSAMNAKPKRLKESTMTVLDASSAIQRRDAGRA